MTEETPRKRVRDPEAHRAAILDAARRAFAEHGYDRATIRDIAARAGVTHGLVMRHFGSKEQLFIAAVPGPRDLADVLPGDPATLPERVAAAFVERMENADHADPFITLVRSAPSREKAAKLYDEMRRASLDPYLASVTGPDAEERVDLLAAHLIGVTFSRYVVRSEPLATMSPERLTDHLARTLRAILLG
ncbi:TetR/AcrR family transcriptional regulator [Saccharothrix coeruleofusca]|uniref:TetR family transcriptional regulator n=1 Tax=Saccharothrix coeruleofusca TaxID=33919 RepID=A0A918AM30_9PSEU|nr:TetR family transcriptional regulator [Saccharothrix coeruleofusca]GGP44829.1 TetR family transcriptional regulator [Saccharothrix coeruleofusca]